MCRENCAHLASFRNPAWSQEIMTCWLLQWRVKPKPQIGVQGCFLDFLPAQVIVNNLHA